MKTNTFTTVSAVTLALLLCPAVELYAQQRGGFGGFGGLGAGAGTANRAGGSQSTMAGQYNNNGSIGSAVITVDPERRVIEDKPAPDRGKIGHNRQQNDEGCASAR